MKKKLLIPLLALFVLVLLALPASATETSGEYGENLRWTLQDGVLTISGTGDMMYLSSGSPYWCSFDFHTAIVEEGITSLCPSAFSYCSNLTTVILPDGIKEIPSSCFAGSNRLTDVRLPAGLEIIGDHAFSNCSSLQTLDLPDTVTTILASAFDGCSGLTTIDLPENLEVLDFAAFRCSGLEHITIPEGITSLSTELFRLCKNLVEVNLPDTLVEIQDNAFDSCSALTSIVLPDSVTIVGSGVFQDSGLQSCTLSKNMTRIGNDMFRFCGGITEFVIPSHITEIGGGAFYYSGLTKIDIPENVTFIGDNAFAFCGGLTNVTFAENAEVRFGNGVFKYCSGLNTIDLPHATKEISQELFAYSGLTSIALPEGLTHISWFAFSGCSGLTKILLPESLVCIGPNAFSECSNLVSCELPEGLTELGHDAFSGTGLTRVVIPKGITELDGSIFGSCANLTEVVIPHTLISISEYLFSYSNNVTIVCQEMSVAHLYALDMEIPVQFLPPLPEEYYHSVELDYNASGLAQITADSAYPGQVILVSTQPNADRILASLLIYYDSEEELELHITELDEGLYSFIMPDCAVYVDVLFLKPENPFTDVKGEDYFFVPVLWAYSDGITAGTSADQFAPGAGCTRAQVVTFLWRAMGQPEPETTVNPFSDVAANAYYYKAVLWAMENGITAGTSATLFSPDAVCTRAQVATFLWRLYGCPDPVISENPFHDVKDGEYFTNAVLWAVEYGITAGTGNGAFSPNNTCTRGQIVTFLYRALG